MDSPAVRDAALLVLRAIIGVVFVAHGYDKAFLTGLDGTTQQFAAWGVPRAGTSATVAMAAELLGGSMLIVGLLTTIAAGGLALLMLAAMYFVHIGNGFYAVQGGVEYPLVLAVSLIVIVVFGAGRASLDGVLQRA